MRRLVLLFALLGAVSCSREKRSLGFLKSSVGAIFGTTTVSPLSKYPVWKVHKYAGVDLKPVHPEEVNHYSDHGDLHGPLEIDGPPPKALEITEGVPVHDFEHDESAAAVASLENLGTLASITPEEPASNSAWASVVGSGRAVEAEDKIGIVKKTKGLLGLLAFSGGLAKGKKVPSLLKGLSFAAPEEIPHHEEHVVYTGVPTNKGGFLSRIPFFGKPKGTPVYLPDPILPKIPHLKLVPEAPKLPKLALPGYYTLPYSTGSYVSVKVPKPHFPVHEEEVISTHDFIPPATTYGIPDLSTQYQLPESHHVVQPAQEYGVPEIQSSVVYPAPQVQYQPVSQQYALPQYTPLPVDYQAPQSYQNIVQHFESPAQPSSSYVPSSPSASPYAPPASSYNPPRPPTTSYNPQPQKYPSTTASDYEYGAPPPSQVSYQYPPLSSPNRDLQSASASEPEVSVVYPQVMPEKETKNADESVSGMEEDEKSEKTEMSN